jgi:Acyl-CoA reductase (LuxC)
VSTPPGDTMVQILAPAGPRIPVCDLLRWPFLTDAPFSEPRLATLANLASMILRHHFLRTDAASVALGFWLRRSNLDRLAASFESRQASAPETVFVPVGRVFHVAPGNVDTMFAYSWALSYLCGNQNLVRVSGNQSDVLRYLLALLATLMQSDHELAIGNRFITYEHNPAITAPLSQWATHRVLWGGDETIALFRAFPISAHASERAFASKFSYSVFSASAYAEAAPAKARKLASGFFNDIFLFDQMACSSPHLVIWVGSLEATDSAVQRFHAELQAEIDRRGYRGGASSAMHRLDYAFDLAYATNLTADLRQRGFIGVRLAEDTAWLKSICGGGLLHHVRASELAQVAAFAEARDQTVTHFGFSCEEIRALAQVAGSRGVDRFVPVGEALNFDVNWDGYDLIGDFVHRVTVRVARYGPPE